MDTAQSPANAPASVRIVRVTNVHFDASISDIARFFSPLQVIDLYRTINPRSGTKSVAYILFATISEKLEACAYSGTRLLGRKVGVQAAMGGNFRVREDESGFINDFEYHHQPLTRLPPARQPRRASTFTDSDFPVLPPVLVSEPSLMSTQATFSETHGMPPSANSSDTAVPGLQQQQQSAPQEGSSDSSWNLSGHDAYDRTKNVVTPDDWYNFDDDQVRKAVEREEKRREELRRTQVIEEPFEGKGEGRVNVV